jgi:AraC-like DNA-binding protein
MDQPFVITSWVDSCLKGFEFRGWTRRELFAQCELDLALLQQPKFPVQALNALFSAAQHRHLSPGVGLEARHGITPNSFQALSLAMMASDNLWQGLQRMIQFNHGITNAVTFFLQEVSSEEGVFGFRQPDPKHAFQPLVYDAILSTIIRTCRFIHPHPPAIRCVEMATEEPIQSEAYKEYFKAPVRWNASCYAVHFDLSYLHQPSMHANPYLARESEHLCTTYFASLQQTSQTQTLRDYVLQNLTESDLCLNTAAEALNMSKRSLQRELSRQGTSFKQILEDVRQQEAQRYLNTTLHSISYIAHAIGFTDTGNFCRAFKRWHQCSPYQYRQQSA